MEHKAIELSHYLLKRLQEIPSESRLLVGITGIPASGKSSFAERVIVNTKNLLREAEEKAKSKSKFDHRDETALTGVDAVLVGLDGWHLTRAQLDALPDPKLAHDRRGIHWTFDSSAYVDFIKTIRAPITPSTGSIIAPSFNHALKDPIPYSIAIHPTSRIILIEGLYTSLVIDPWIQATKLLDERWLIEVDFGEAQRRLVKRHVRSGVGKDEEEAVWRAEENDMPNGRFVIANSMEPTRSIQSVDDPALASR